MILTLFIFAFILASIELFLPGGVLGGIALLMTIIACILVFKDYGFAYGLLSVIISAVFAVLLIYVWVQILNKTALGRSFTLFTDLKNKTTENNEKTTESSPKIPTGSGKCLTDLRPIGKVEFINLGKIIRLEAKAVEGFIPKGAKVKSLRIKEGLLRVQKFKC